MAQFDTLNRKAKNLESRLEKKIQSYSTCAQKINADFLCDEENPLMENNEEQVLSVEIERELAELNDCIQNMRQCNSGKLTSHQEVLIKRYHEIHFDYNTEFKNTSATVQRKRESMELFQSSNSLHKSEQDSSVAKLLRERSRYVCSRFIIFLSPVFRLLHVCCTIWGGVWNGVVFLLLLVSVMPSVDVSPAERSGGSIYESQTNA